MKMKKPFTVTLGMRGYPMTESSAEFEHPEISGTWRVVEGPDRYILCEDHGRHLRFVEFIKKPGENLVLYKAREWERRSRDDNNYTLTKPAKYHGTRMPTEFSQALKNLHAKT